MATIRYDQVPLIIQFGKRTERMIARECSLSEAADLTPIYSIGKYGISEQAPQGARTASISFSYSPVLTGLIREDTGETGSYNIINDVANSLKNSKNSQTSGVSIRFGNISGEGLLSSYSLSLQPYSPVECSVNFELFGSGENLPVSGDLQAESPESFKYINSKLAAQYGHSAHSAFMTAGSPATITSSNETGILTSVDYSINFEYEPVYKLGQEFPSSFLYHKANEEANLSENVRETGIAFTGKSENFNLNIRSLDNQNAILVKMNEPVLSNTQLRVSSQGAVETKKTIRSFY